MTAKIYRFHQHKHIEFVDIFPKGKKLNFDVLLHINKIPYLLKNVKISNINKNKMKFDYESFYHHQDEKNNIDLCPFCHKPYDDSICEVLTKEKEKLFSKEISQQLFFPMISYYYNGHDDAYFETLAKQPIDNFEPLFFGVSEGTFIQCIFKYKNELLLFQDIIDSTNAKVLPYIFYKESELNQLHLYIEYLLPEKLLPLTGAINKSLHKPNVELFDTTGIELLELYNNYKKMQEPNY